MDIDSGTERRVAALCRRVLREHPVPGLSVAVVTPGGAAYASGFGARDLTGNRPASPDTLYGVGSLTKSFTATAVLQLAEAGMCDLADPVAEYLDVDLGDRSDGDGGSEPIRIRHLLSHTSGLPSLGISEALIARRVRRGDPGIPLSSEADLRAHIEEAVAAGEVVAPPGERFAYCNAGYVLAGDLIEQLTGKRYAEYVADHLFEPLGMERSTFDDTTFAMDDDHMTQYLIEDGELVAASLPHRELTLPTGGVLTSVRELGYYLRCHLAGGDTTALGDDAGTGPLLPGDRMAELYGHYAETPEGPCGYGWRTREVCGRELIGHAGSIGVSSAFAGFCLGEELGVAVAANSSPSMSMARVGEGVVAALLGEDPDVAVPYFRRDRLYDRLTGEYASFRGVKPAAVDRIGGSLRLTLGGAVGGSVRSLRPVDLGSGVPDALGAGDEVEFVAEGAGGEAEPAVFRFEGDGGVRLLVDRWNLRKVAERPPEVESGPGEE